MFELIQLLFGILLNPLVLTLILMCLICFLTYIYIVISQYKKTAYYQVTKLSYFSVINDLGRYGEYLTYKNLQHFEKYGAKFLFNIYVPKENDKTTEIDVLMVCAKGIFVFESKNYSGWIFGSDNQKNWYQTLPVRRGESHKEPFYNPIMQNKTHIKYLKTLLDDEYTYNSIIVFSDRCTLKNINITNKDVIVINRYDLNNVITNLYNQNQTRNLTENDINKIYSILYPFSQTDDQIKKKHIDDINNDIKAKLISTDENQNISSEETNINNNTESTNLSDFNDTNKTNDDRNDMANDNTPSAIPTVTPNASISNDPSNIVETEREVAKPINDNKENTPILKCPKCNGNLVLRTATKGNNAGNQFYGCTNYPKCKYIQNLS